MKVTTECGEMAAVIGKASRKRQALQRSLSREGRLLGSTADDTEQDRPGGR